MISQRIYGLLGDDIPSIAYEKGSIIRNEIPVVIGNLLDEAYKASVSSQRKGMLRYIDTTHVNMLSEEGEETHPCNSQTHKLVVQPQMLGEHQKHNMSIVAIVSLLLQQFFPCIYRNIEQGIAHSQYRGRLEQIHPRVLIDCAHNEGGAIALRMYLEKRYGNDKKPILSLVHLQTKTSVVSSLNSVR